jgi:tryptophanase
MTEPDRIKVVEPIPLMTREELRSDKSCSACRIPRQVAEAAFRLVNGCVASMKTHGLAIIEPSGIPAILGEEDDDGEPLVAVPCEVRLAIPRPASTQAHIEYVGRVAARVAGSAGSWTGI